MGKRKERRLAAKMASNRRVKLDLVAEPSGDMVASSAHDEVGGDIDQDHHAVVPTSPSSSGGSPEFLFKGLYREDMPAQHIFGGYLDILQDLLHAPRIWF